MPNDMSIVDFPLSRLARDVSLAPPPRVGLGAWSPDLATALSETAGYEIPDMAEALDDAVTLLRDQMTLSGNAAAEILDAIRAQVEGRSDG